MGAIRHKNLSAPARADEYIVAALSVMINFVSCLLIISRFARRSSGICVAFLAMRCTLNHLKASSS